mgnify:FL=1
MRRGLAPLVVCFVIPEIFYRESTEEGVFPSSVDFVSLCFLFVFQFFWGIIKGCSPLLFGVIRGIYPPYSLLFTFQGAVKLFHLILIFYSHIYVKGEFLRASFVFTMIY